MNIETNPDALPQLMGEFKPVDQWQAHISAIFYGLRGRQAQDYYQTFASADYRLAHALAADYFSRVCAREKSGGKGVKGIKGVEGVKGNTATPLHPYPSTPLIIHEWGPGNGNLAACFLSHLKSLDKDGLVYPRVRYVLVDVHQAMLDGAKSRPDLAPHLDRVETLCADASALSSVADGTVDRIFCNELWNDLPAKLMLRKGNEFEEEYLRPNLHEKRHAAIDDWSGFVRAFDELDVAALQTFPAFLEDIIWEKEYRKAEWKDVPYRKTITDFLKQVDDHVLVPVNLGAFATLKEAKRLLAPSAAGFSAFDAGASEMAVLNDPEKPCYGLFGGQYSFMVNFSLVESVASQVGVRTATVETQREFIGRSLGTNVISLMDLLASYPALRSLRPWEQDRLTLKTVLALKAKYRSPYQRRFEFPISHDTPPQEREGLQAILLSLGTDCIPDTVAYVTEEEITGAIAALEQIGYHRDAIMATLAMPPQPIDYRLFSF